MQMILAIVWSNYNEIFKKWNLEKKIGYIKKITAKMQKKKFLIIKFISKIEIYQQFLDL